MEKRSIYCNKVAISANINEIRFRFDKTEPIFNDKYEIIEEELVEATLIHMSPQYAKSMLNIFNTLINEYEKSFGEIITEVISKGE